MAGEMFQSSVHPDGRIAAVFEYDGETGFIFWTYREAVTNRLHLTYG